MTLLPSFITKLKTYNIGAKYTRNDTYYFGNKSITIPLLLNFNLYNVSCGIRIRNNTSSIKNIPITCYIRKKGSLIDSLIIESAIRYANYYTTDSGMYQFLFVNDTYNCSFMDSIYFTPSTNIPHFEISTSNTLDSATTCNYQPIELTIYCKENKNRPIYSTTWFFGDSTTFHNSYNKISHLFSFNGDLSNSKYNIFAEVLDTNGCYYYSDTLKLISVSDSANLIQQYEFVSQLICPGQAKTITIDVNHIYPDNNIFYWQPQNIANYNINTIDVYNTNTYKVRVTNQTYCQADALKTIPFLNCPTANICSEKQYYCQADNMILSAQDGNTTTQYLWSISDSNGLNILSANTPTIQIPKIAPNIYTAILKVSDHTSHCFSYDTMTIKVYPSPNAPHLDFGNNKCIDNPPVILTTTANSPANKVYWNNGTYSHSAKYYSSSWATAYYYDTMNGCKSQTAKIYINPSPNFDALLTGCYNYCGPYPYLMQIAGLTMDTNLLDWTWICNSNPISSGSGYYYNSILPLNIPQNGNYELVTIYNNGYCVTESPQLILDNTNCIYMGGSSGGSGQGNYIPCNLDIDVFYKINIIPNSCPWQFGAVVTICNNSNSTVCINYIDSPYKNIIQNLYINNSNFTILLMIVQAQIYILRSLVRS